MLPAFARVSALFGVLAWVPSAGADTFHDVLAAYGSGSAEAGGTYLLDGEGAQVTVTSTLGLLPNGSTWGITVDNGASLRFSGLTERAWGNSPGQGAGATVSISARNGGRVSFEDLVNSTTSYVYGGVITKNAGTLSLSGVDFTNNATTVTQSGAVAIGGAIYSNYGTTNLTDTSFTRNVIMHSVSGRSAYGGAIYQNGGTLNLTVSSGRASSFTGNKAQGLASSVHLSSGTFNVVTQGSGVLDMVDPMTGGTTSGVTNAATSATINKTGDGTWRLGGANVFSDVNAAYKTTFKVGEGTLRLYAEGEASTVPGVVAAVGTLSFSGVASVFSVESGAKLVAAGKNAVSVAANTAANAIEFKAGSSVDLLGDAQLALTGNVMFNDGVALSFDYGSGAINSATTALITVDGTLTLADGADFFVDLNGFADGEYQLISASASIVGSATGTTTRFTSDLDGAVFHFGEDGRSVWVSIAAIPEPGTWAGVVGGIVLLSAVLRRRRRVA